MEPSYLGEGEQSVALMFFGDYGGSMVTNGIRILDKTDPRAFDQSLALVQCSVERYQLGQYNILLSAHKVLAAIS